MRKAVTKNLPDSDRVADVVAAGEGVLEPGHACDEVGLGGFDEEVIVVAHERPCMDVPAGHLAGLGEGVEEEAAVVVVKEDGLPAVATGHDVVVGAGGLDADAAGHG